MAAAGEYEQGPWVPVRMARLIDLLFELDTVLDQRRREYRWERVWEKEAMAAPAAGLDAAQRLDLARRLNEVVSLSWYAIACTLSRFGEGLDDAEDPDFWPRPESADWWRWHYGDGRRAFQRFAHLSAAQLARARELRDDAYARTQRVRAVVEDLGRRCRGPAAPAEEHSIPGLMQRLHHVQRLTDAVVLRLQELRRLVDGMIAARDGTRASRSGGRRRGRSAPPPPLKAAATAMHPVLTRRRSASMLGDVAASS